MEEQSKNYVGGSFTGNFIGGNASGNVSNIINELPSSSEADRPGIKELLIQLQDAIEAEPNLNDDDREEASEQIKIIAEAGKNPTEGEMKKLAKKATTMLKGIIVGLPAAAKLAEEWNNILPLIAKAFGF
ncbi:hypothetical protein QUA56_32645 [Microcoleus sp. N3A4]|uniref:hypothetical protein n=1 Tax=Microcoleus sp. N3A4 TaxID=3055379 RepID=UPI002FD3FFFE